MTLPAFADTEALGARLDGGLADGDVPRAQGALDDASSAIRGWAGRSWCNEAGTEIDFGDVPAYLQDEIARICLAVAKRSFTNPDGVTEAGAGPFRTAFADSSADVYLKASEKAVISQAAGKTGVTTISTTREETAGASDLGIIDDRTGTIYAPVDDGEPIPWLDDRQGLG